MSDLILKNDSLPSTRLASISIEDAVRLWLAQYRSANTRAAYAREVSAFASFANKGPLEAVEWLLALEAAEAHIVLDAYRAALLGQEKAPSTINRSMSALASLVRSARRHGLTALHIDMKNLKAEAYRDTRGPGTRGVNALLRVARANRHKWRSARDEAIVRVLFTLGLRRAELCSLDLEHMAPDASTLAVLGKGKAERKKMTVPAATRGALLRWIDRRGQDPGPLFLGQDSKERISPSGLYHIIKVLGDRAGIRARPHGIRHAAITEVLKVTQGDLRKAQAFGRHASATTTLVYDDSRLDHAGDAAAIIDALME